MAIIGGFSDPNFLQWLGQAGAGIARGDSIGEALNPAAAIAQASEQRVAEELLQRMMGQQEGPAEPPVPTPKGQKGPDSVTTKQTADGTTTTIQSPSDKNISTYGTNVPLESQPAMVGGDTGGGGAPATTGMGGGGGGGRDGMRMPPGYEPKPITFEAGPLTEFQKNLKKEEQMAGGGQSPFWQALLG